MESQLIDLLRRYLDVHRDLLRCAEEMRAALLRGDLARLQDVVQRERAGVQRLAELEAERAALVAKACRRWGLAAESVTLSELVRHIPNPEARAEAEALGRELAALLSRLRRENGHNQELLADALAHVEASLALLADARRGGDVTYAPAGRSGVAPLHSVFDQKV